MNDPALSAYVEQRDTLIAIAARIVENQAVAEELVQDSWLRWLAKDYPSDKATPILRRIVSNLALDWSRSRRVERLALEEFCVDDRSAASSERVVIARQEIRAVVAVLERMPKRTVRAFRYRFIDGLTYAEIGRRLNISLSRSHALIEDALVEITVRLS